MNQRIRELAEQAKLYDGWFCGQGNIEKFAELIVQECAALCDATAAGRDAEAIAEAILAHFGVEE